MGLVLDSSVIIAAERETRGAQESVSQLLESLSAEHSETEFLLSAITVMELEHGWHRAKTPEIAAKRRRYLDEVLAVLPVEPFTGEMGSPAAKVDVEMKKAGLVIATADLLIGITALHLGYAVGTRNVRHFRMIPGLKVLPL
jgi:predicted nucleic acid-binding protein